MFNKFLHVSKNIYCSGIFSVATFDCLWRTKKNLCKVFVKGCGRRLWFGMANCAEHYTWWPLLCQKSLISQNYVQAGAICLLDSITCYPFFLCFKKVKIEMYRKGYAMLRATDVHKNIRQIVLQGGMWEVVKKTYICNRKWLLQAPKGSKYIYSEDYNADTFYIYNINSAIVAFKYKYWRQFLGRAENFYDKALSFPIAWQWENIYWQNRL